MYKLGRGGGGGRGGGKRPLPLPPQTRPTTAPSSGRAPLGGGGRSRPGSAPAPMGKEEGFSLSSASDLDFGAIIRLTPDIIEEMKRVESLGGSAKIMFARNSNFPGGNVIDVGGKEFGFTWSRDDLCDIYEECQNGEDGEGLLVERGSAWRKLNVHRILDESTKKHVKKRSEEAERLSKSRKAKFLDPSNPAMKNQVKKMAAAGVEGNMRRMGWKQKKEPFHNKQKAEPNQGPPKSVYKSGTSSNKPSKGMISVSPTASPRDPPQGRTSVSPFATGNSSRGDTKLEEIIAPLDINKEHIDIGNFEKEMPSRILQGAKHNGKGRTSDQPIDLQNGRTQRVSQNSMGLNRKAMEKAVGDTSPCPMKKNESIPKPVEEQGKHINPGEEFESSKRRGVESGSSPESANDITSAIFGTDEDLEHQPQPSSNFGDDFERIDIMQEYADPSSNNDKKINNASEGKTSSSESGSDSDSDSESSDSGSDSGSQSRSRSKSRSPAGSAGASSSDSESDGPSSSKEGSDVDVDIMNSEDEKAAPKAHRTSDDEQEQIDIMGDPEDQVVSLAIDLNDFGRNDEAANVIDAKDFPSNNGFGNSEIPDINHLQRMGSESYRANSGFPVEGSPFSPGQYKPYKDLVDPYEKVTKNTANEKQPIYDDWSAHDQTETVHKGKTKMASSSDHFNDKQERAKRFKSSKAAEVMPSGRSKDGTTSYTSPDKSRQDQFKSNNDERIGARDVDYQEHNQTDRSRSVPFGNLHRMQQSPELWNASNIDAEQPVTRTSDISGRRKSMDRFNKNSERMPVDPSTLPRNKVGKDIQDDSKVGDYWKENGPPSQIRNKSSVSAKGSGLRRELSDLELGELREAPASNETGVVSRHFEGKQSFNSLESKLDVVDNTLLDASNGRSGPHHPVESKKYSSYPHNLRGEVSENQRTKPYQSQQPSKIDHTDLEVKFHREDSTELMRRGETGTNLALGMEKHAASVNKTPPDVPVLHDNKHAGQKGNRNSKESKQQKFNTLVDSEDRSNNSASMGNYVNSRKRRESSFEDDISFYSKYDKEVPELRDRIKDFSQYQEYLQEYSEKYDCYFSLSKNLENIRNDFLKVGEKLELTKGRNSEEYYKVVDQLREMYHQHGERNMQMKKVFILLHEELKTLKQRIKEFADVHAKE